MGGDLPPLELYHALLPFSSKLDPNITLILVAEEGIRLEGIEKSPLQVIYTEESIEMHEPPLFAVRKKKNSSMGVGVRLVQEREIDAFVSLGNTGALVAFSRLALPLLPTIEKPALLATLPTLTRKVGVLDVGAHVLVKPENFIDYAKLGVAFRTLFHGITDPKVGLLNIGTEEIKGTKDVQEAFTSLQEHFKGGAATFVGNIEGREVFQGKVDVLVTDGFTGNVFLKTCEGASLFLLDYLRSYFSQESSEGCGKKLLRHFHEQFNYTENPGAFLCGLEGIVVKCHGYSNSRALINGIQGAIELVKKDIITQMKSYFHK
jgi:glycerol-3-phosphate acyltransferase PlsX